MFVFGLFFYLSEKPEELHALGGCVAALNEAGSAVDIHQALVVVVVDGGTQNSHVELLGAGVVHILEETHRHGIRSGRTLICQPGAKSGTQ